MWAAALWCAVAGANGAGGVWWLELMMEAACMHVWAHVKQSCRRRCSIIISNKLYFFFKKTIIVMSPANVNKPIATVTQ
jgi:hypothetical protein